MLLLRRVPSLLSPHPSSLLYYHWQRSLLTRYEPPSNCNCLIFSLDSSANWRKYLGWRHGKIFITQLDWTGLENCSSQNLWKKSLLQVWPLSVESSQPATYIFGLSCFAVSRNIEVDINQSWKAIAFPPPSTLQFANFQKKKWNLKKKYFKDIKKIKFKK